MHALNQLLATLKIEANVFHNGQYCGVWAVDTSGQNRMTFHVVSAGKCFLSVDEQTLELHTGDAIFFPNDAQHRASNLATSDTPVNQAKSLPMTEVLEEEATGLVCGHFGHDHPLKSSNWPCRIQTPTTRDALLRLKFRVFGWRVFICRPVPPARNDRPSRNRG